jgi:hypothetical protein
LKNTNILIVIFIVVITAGFVISCGGGGGPEGKGYFTDLSGDKSYRIL